MDKRFKFQTAIDQMTNEEMRRHEKITTRQQGNSLMRAYLASQRRKENAKPN